MKKEFLDLGRQPIANRFLNEDEFNDEFFFDLKVVFDEDTNLVSLKEFVAPEMMFNDQMFKYSYLSLNIRNWKYNFIPNKQYLK